MGKRKFMSTRVLKPGIRIDQSIIAKDGRILIQKGTILDDFQIDYLLTQGIMGIYIYEGVPDLDEQQLNISAATQRVIEQNRREDPVKVSLSESVRKQVGEGISHLFRNTESSDFTKASNTIASELENTIINNDAIAVDIRELKVSDEYTFRHSVDVATISL
ncbi:MAG: HD-GYP domain-containing protein, partial [Lachnospiraceae bacterium]|nr:HD-GYP domain-containing protein [Lachnospiraceae bacterium]